MTEEEADRIIAEGVPKDGEGKKRLEEALVVKEMSEGFVKGEASEEARAAMLKAVTQNFRA